MESWSAAATGTGIRSGKGVMTGLKELAPVAAGVNGFSVRVPDIFGAGEAIELRGLLFGKSSMMDSLKVLTGVVTESWRDTWSVAGEYTMLLLRIRSISKAISRLEPPS